jgi:hypothetical protein
MLKHSDEEHEAFARKHINIAMGALAHIGIQELDAELEVNGKFYSIKIKLIEEPQHDRNQPTE